MEENARLASMEPQSSLQDQSLRNDAFTFSQELPTAKQLQASFPKAWYLFGADKELSRGPTRKKLLGQSLVGFKTASGKFGVMNSKCSHLGADLSGGCVIGESIQCPFHGWEYDTDGTCSNIPATPNIPALAAQTAFPTQVLFGNVYFFYGPEPTYELPFFDGIEPDELAAGPPFVFELNTPWYMIGSNGVDEQHFLRAHDRKLLECLRVEYPRPELHRTIALFEVVGTSLSDRMMKACGGSQVNLRVDDWSSTFILTRSSLKKTESFGVLSATPITANQTRVTVTACGWKSKSVLGKLIDPVSARLRSYFIREFLRGDVVSLEGSDFSPHVMMEVDQQYVDYMQWAASLPRKT